MGGRLHWKGSEDRAGWSIATTRFSTGSQGRDITSRAQGGLQCSDSLLPRLKEGCEL